MASQPDAKEKTMMSDSILKQRVTEELRWETKIDEARIGVAASAGAITLSGHVATYPEKYAAVQAAKRVFGVKAIADEIVVDLPNKYRLDDSKIAERISNVLQWNIAIPESAIQAKVHDGFVTLTGEVDWQHQRVQVEQQVRHVSGIKGVVNAITLKKRATPENVKAKIEEALIRHSKEEAKGIKVSVVGETVTLDGSVDAFYERDLIENAVWKAPGVNAVVDHLRVG